MGVGNVWLKLKARYMESSNW